MKHIYKTKGVCAREIEIEVENDIVKAVKFLGGCAGNTQGVAKLVAGMPIDQVIDRLKGIRCGFKSTSCPDQLSAALEQIKSSKD